MRPSWINLLTLLVAGGVITVLVLIPVLLITGDSPILGSWWVGGGGGGRRGVRRLDADAARRSTRWQRAAGGAGARARRADAAFGARHHLPVRPDSRRAAGGAGGRAGRGGARPCSSTTGCASASFWRRSSSRVSPSSRLPGRSGRVILAIADDRPDLAVRPEPRRSEQSRRRATALTGAAAASSTRLSFRCSSSSSC